MIPLMIFRSEKCSEVPDIDEITFLQFKLAWKIKSIISYIISISVIRTRFIGAIYLQIDVCKLVWISSCMDIEEIYAIERSSEYSTVECTSNIIFDFAPRYWIQGTEFIKWKHKLIYFQQSKLSFAFKPGFILRKRRSSFQISTSSVSTWITLNATTGCFLFSISLTLFDKIDKFSFRLFRSISTISDGYGFALPLHKRGPSTYWILLTLVTEPPYLNDITGKDFLSDRIPLSMTFTPRESQLQVNFKLDILSQFLSIEHWQLVS